MGKKKKKEADFQKVKLKVGKTLKKTNTTDTTFKSKKLSTPVTSTVGGKSTLVIDRKNLYHGHTFDELCTMLGHFNAQTRKDAIVGIRQLLEQNATLARTQLRTIVPTVGRLLVDTEADWGSLAALLKKVFGSVDETLMRPHFALLTAHILRALTHIQNLFPSFVRFLSAPRLTPTAGTQLARVLATFLNVYQPRDVAKPPCVEISMDLNAKTVEPVWFSLRPKDGTLLYFPVISVAEGRGAETSGASPMENPETLVDLASAVAPLAASQVDREQQERKSISKDHPVVKSLNVLTETYRRVQETMTAKSELEKEWRSAWIPLVKTARSIESRHLKQQLENLIGN